MRLFGHSICAAVMAISLCAMPQEVWAGVPTDQLLPSTTRGYVTIANLPATAKTWANTSLGKMLDDKRMQEFSKDLRNQITRKWLKAFKDVDVTWDDLVAIVSGELAVAVIGDDAKQLKGLVLIADIEGKSKETKALLDRISQSLKKQKAESKQTTVQGTTVTVHTMEVKGEKNKKRRVQMAEFQKDDRLVLTSSPEVAALILGRWKGNAKDGLNSVEAYQKVMTRCESAAAGLAPEIRWFAEPIAAAFALREITQSTPKGTDYLTIVKEQGFTAVHGVGGYGNFATAEYDSLFRIFVYAPKPYELAMRMLSLPNGGDLMPMDWVPRGVATYMSFNLDFQNGFDNFGTLFDAIYNEKGVWEDTLQSVKTDPNGPQIDIRDDLVAHLGGRGIVMRDFTLPISPHCERRLFAVEVANQEALMTSIERSMQGDPNVRELEIAGHKVWEISEESAPKDDLPQIDIDEDTESEDEGDGKDAGMEVKKLPNSAVAVVDGYLLVASHIDFLERVISPINESDRLINDVAFQRVINEARRLNGDAEKCAVRFARTNEQYRITYELFRTGKLPEADTILAQVLNSLLSTEKEEEEGILRKPKLDGSKLPEFEAIESYLGDTGLIVSTEEEGWMATGFSINLEHELANDPDNRGATSR